MAANFKNFPASREIARTDTSTASAGKDACGEDAMASARAVAIAIGRAMLHGNVCRGSFAPCVRRRLTAMHAAPSMARVGVAMRGGLCAIFSRCCAAVWCAMETEMWRAPLGDCGVHHRSP